MRGSRLVCGSLVKINIYVVFVSVILVHHSSNATLCPSDDEAMRIISAVIMGCLGWIYHLIVVVCFCKP